MREARESKVGKALGLDKKSKMMTTYFFYIGGYKMVNSQQ